MTPEERAEALARLVGGCGVVIGQGEAVALAASFRRPEAARRGLAAVRALFADAIREAIRAERREALRYLAARVRANEELGERSVLGRAAADEARQIEGWLLRRDAAAADGGGA